VRTMACVPDSLLRTPHLLATYAAIAMYADAKGQAYPSMERLSEDLGLAKRTTYRYVSALVGLGLVSRDARMTPDGQTTSLLTLTVPPDGTGGVPWDGTQKELPPMEVVLSQEVVGTSSAAVERHTLSPNGTPPAVDTVSAHPFPDFWFKNNVGPITADWRSCWESVCTVAQHLDPAEHLTMYWAKKRKAHKPTDPYDWVIWFTADDAKAKPVEQRSEDDGYDHYFGFKVAR
jgi:Helix-turn-helix domain